MSFQNLADEFDQDAKNCLFKILPVTIQEGRIVDYTGSISDEEIREVFLMPKKGIKISLHEAIRMRHLTAIPSSGPKNFKILGTRIAKWAQDRGFFIKIEENEIEIQNTINSIIA